MKANINPQKIKEILSRGIEEVIEKENLKKRLLSGEKLRIKFGIDPTAPDLHVGHSLPLLKLKEFQELGHQVVFLIGDFTARIGDPTGRTISRFPLSSAQVKKNMKSYQSQAAKLLDMDKVRIRYNSEWWDKMKLEELMFLAAKVTYSQASQRADFKKRLAEDKDFTLEEFMYPVLQGYDSVALKSDLEIGGSDQKFNMLMGRRIQKKYKQPPQDVMTLNLLIGTDGKQKMSQSLGNYIGISEKPAEQFGKIMSIPDGLILEYFELATRLPLEEVQRLKAHLRDKKITPQLLKTRLAREIVSIYHNKQAGIGTEREFKRVFKEKKPPLKMPSVSIKQKELNLLDLLVKTRLAPSRSEAKRLVVQGGVKIEGRVQKDWQKTVKTKKGMVLQVGKRKFIKVS